MTFRTWKWVTWETSFLAFFAVLLLAKLYIWSLHWEIRGCVLLLASWVWFTSAIFATPLIFYLRTKWPNPFFFVFLSYIGVYIAFALARYLLAFSVWPVISYGYLSCAWPTETNAVDFYSMLGRGSALFGISLTAFVSLHLIFQAIKDKWHIALLIIPSLIMILSVCSLVLTFNWR